MGRCRPTCSGWASGRYVLLDTPLPPIVGDWQITLQIRVDDFNEADVNFTDDVR